VAVALLSSCSVSFCVNHLVGGQASHEVVPLFSKHDQVFILCEVSHCVEPRQDLGVLSLSLHRLDHLAFGLSLQGDCLTDNLGILLLCFGDLGEEIGVSFSSYLGCFGLGVGQY
jgi:hypothetical protein